MKMKLLRTGCLLALGLNGAVAPIAFAQDTSAPSASSGSEGAVLDEVVVTGIRRSLMTSAAIKMDADVVVDAITAEDIGKFPDQNIAESLQRITGVTIDRSGGEGQLLTVRGMGPEFNSTLLNGRTLATTSGGRAFSFDIMPSELIGGAEVYKTQTAALQEGAIGATVNLTTLRPLSFPGFQAVTSASALYDGMTEEVKPQFSGLISNTFADGTFGALASFAYADRESRYDQANTASYFKTTDDLDGQNYGEVYFPRNYDQIAQTETRERMSGSLAFQFRPSDSLEITADALYSHRNTVYRQDVFPHWFTTDTVRNPVLDDNNTLIRADFEGGAIESLVRQSDADDELWIAGLNADWRPTDHWKIVADVSYSTAESDPGQGYSDTVVGRPGRYSYDRSSGDLMPTMTFPDGDTLDPNGLFAGWSSLQGTRVEDEVLEAKLDNSFELDDAGPLKEVRFGGFYSDRTLGTTWGETEYPLPWTFGDNIPRIAVPASLFSTYNAHGFLSAGSGQSVQQWLTFNSNDLFAFLTSEQAISQITDPDAQAAVRDIIARNGGFAMVPDPAAYEVSEKVASLYADVRLDGDIGSMPWSAVLGIRYARTKSSSAGRQVALLDLEPDLTRPGDVRAIESEDYVPVEVGHTYDDLLPSINTKLELMDGLIARFGWSKSLTRPELDQMSPLTSYAGGPIDQLSGSGSNPLLQPYKSENIDVSLEWYYQEGGYISVAGFRKDVDGYLGTAEVRETVTVPSGTYEYLISRPVNLDSTEIKGVEFAVQHMFTYLPAPFDGFGAAANITSVDSSTSSDVPGEKLPLIGLSDSQNFILFYEKGPLQLRVAYNKRDRFLQSKPTTRRDGHYVADYYQVDVGGSYALNDALSIVLEGINVTNELYIKNAELPNQTLEVTETGPRYSLGVRAKF